MVILPVVKKIGPMYFYFTSKGIAPKPSLKIGSVNKAFLF